MIGLWNVEDLGRYFEGRKVVYLAECDDRTGWELDDGTAIWCVDVDWEDSAGEGGHHSANKYFPLNATVDRLRYTIVGTPGDEYSDPEREKCAIWAVVRGKEHLLAELHSQPGTGGPTIEVNRPGVYGYKPIRP